MSTRAGIDVLQLLILANNGDVNKRAILDLIKSMNSSGSIDILKSMKAQAIILKAYTQCMVKEKQFLSKQLEKNNNCIIQRKYNKLRLIDYAYSLYLYKGNYALFQVEDFNRKGNFEEHLQNEVNMVYSIMDLTKSKEQTLTEIMSKYNNVKDVRFSHSAKTRIEVILQDDTSVFSGVDIGSTKLMIENGFETLEYSEPDTAGLPIIDNVQNILSALKDDVNNLCPIKGIKALGYDNNNRFGFNKFVSFEKEKNKEVSLNDAKRIFFIRALEVCENQIDFLEEIIGSLISTINEPKEATMYLGKNIINLNRGQGFILIDSYKQQMKKLKEARPENIIPLGNIIKSDCESLITTQTISKTSFEQPDASTYEDYCRAINNCGDLTDKDKQLYKIDLTDITNSQCLFVKELADRKVIYDTGKCSLPKSIIVLIKLFAVLNPEDDMLSYYNKWFGLDFSINEWNALISEVFEELSLTFCGYATKMLLKNYTKITCAVSQEVFEAIKINPNVTEMAIKLNRGVYSYMKMSEHFRKVR
jgi:hypothetical protein